MPKFEDVNYLNLPQQVAKNKKDIKTQRDEFEEFKGSFSPFEYSVFINDDISEKWRDIVPHLAFYRFKKGIVEIKLDDISYDNNVDLAIYENFDSVNIVKYITDRRLLIEYELIEDINDHWPIQKIKITGLETKTIYLDKEEKMDSIETLGIVGLTGGAHIIVKPIYLI